MKREYFKVTMLRAIHELAEDKAEGLNMSLSRYVENLIIKCMDYGDFPKAYRRYNGDVTRAPIRIKGECNEFVHQAFRPNGCIYPSQFVEGLIAQDLGVEL